VLKRDKDYKKAYDNAFRMAKQTEDAEVNLLESVGLRQSKSEELNEDVLARELS
jgi:hypothetical protein